MTLNTHHGILDFDCCLINGTVKPDRRARAPLPFPSHIFHRKRVQWSRPRCHDLVRGPHGWAPLGSTSRFFFHVSMYCRLLRKTDNRHSSSVTTFQIYMHATESLETIMIDLIAVIKCRSLRFPCRDMSYDGYSF